MDQACSYCLQPLLKKIPRTGIMRGIRKVLYVKEFKLGLHGWVILDDLILKKSHEHFELLVLGLHDFNLAGLSSDCIIEIIVIQRSLSNKFFVLHRLSCLLLYILIYAHTCTSYMNHRNILTLLRTISSLLRYMGVSSS